MTAAAASCNCIALTYMSWLTDFAVWHCFEGKIFSFAETFEARELVFGQIAYIPLITESQSVHDGLCAPDLYSWFSDFAL